LPRLHCRSFVFIEIILPFIYKDTIDPFSILIYLSYIATSDTMAIKAFSLYRNECQEILLPNDQSEWNPDADIADRMMLRVYRNKKELESNCASWKT
jgi:hypothetical protein